MRKRIKTVCASLVLCLFAACLPAVPAYAVKYSAIQKTRDQHFWYISKVPLKKEYQKILWDFCIKRNVDYIDMLALISLESNYDEKCSSGSYKGLFQISKTNGANLAKALKTPNTPFNGAININWGTAMYSSILRDTRLKNLEGKKKRDAALSIYSRGTGGYDRHGLNSRFLKVYYKKRAAICAYAPCTAADVLQ